MDLTLLAASDETPKTCGNNCEKIGDVGLMARWNSPSTMWLRGSVSRAGEYAHQTSINSIRFHSEWNAETKDLFL